jgi:hypothetical protein
MKRQCSHVFIIVLMVSCMAWAEEPVSFTDMNLKTLVEIGLGIIYVDDNAPNDPGPSDCLVSDPNEDGSLEHPFDAIQEAIDVSVEGDTVIVMEGTYIGEGNRDIDFSGKAITVRSIDPNDPNVVTATIIDCQGSEGDPHRGFYFHSGETSTAVLDGFTIKNGYVREGGAGIYCRDSDPLIKNCEITDNTAVWVNPSGGGCYFYHSSAKMMNCRVTSNSAVSNSTKGGNGWGGGISIVGDSNIVIADSQIMDNHATFFSGGIGNHSSALSVINTVISHNSSQFGAGFSFQDANTVITNSTITGNSAEESGGGFYHIRSNIVVTNTILWGNTGGEIDGWGSPAVTITYSDVQGGWPGVGNIDQDPMFADVNGFDDIGGTRDDDLRLLPGSPCIDAGDNHAIPVEVTTDLDGLPRFFDDPNTVDTGNGTAPMVDMGAYEWQRPDDEGLVLIFDTYPARTSNGWGIGGTGISGTGPEPAFQFTVKDASYQLQRITVRGLSNDGSVVLHLYTDQSHEPGVEIASWGPTPFPTDRWPGEDLVVDTPSGPILQADTKYWLGITADPVDSEHTWIQSTLPVSSIQALRYHDNPVWNTSPLPGAGDSHIGAMRLEGIAQ